MYVEFVWLSPSLIHYVEKAVLMQLWNLFVEFQYQDCLKEDNPQEGNLQTQWKIREQIFLW